MDKPSFRKNNSGVNHKYTKYYDVKEEVKLFLNELSNNK